MDIENFIAEFKKTFVCDMLSMSLKDEQLFEHVVDDDGVLWFKEQTRQMWSMWQAAEAKAVPEGFVLIKDDTKTVVAIERMVEQQVEASGMDSRRLERLDGWKIIEAAVEAQEQTNDK